MRHALNHILSISRGILYCFVSLYSQVSFHFMVALLQLWLWLWSKCYCGPFTMLLLCVVFRYSCRCCESEWLEYSIFCLCQECRLYLWVRYLKFWSQWYNVPKTIVTHTFVPDTLDYWSTTSWSSIQSFTRCSDLASFVYICARAEPASETPQLCFPNSTSWLRK